MCRQIIKEMCIECLNVEEIVTCWLKSGHRTYSQLLELENAIKNERIIFMSDIHPK